jgi:gluconokinase
MTTPEVEHIWVITGPAGCGKTTVASYLSQELGYPYLEGDDVRTRHGRLYH